MVAVRLLPDCTALAAGLIRRTGSRLPGMTGCLLIYLATFGTFPVGGTSRSGKIPLMPRRFFHDGLAG